MGSSSYKTLAQYFLGSQTQSHLKQVWTSRKKPEYCILNKENTAIRSGKLFLMFRILSVKKSAKAFGNATESWFIGSGVQRELWNCSLGVLLVRIQAVKNAGVENLFETVGYRFLWHVDSWFLDSLNLKATATVSWVIGSQKFWHFSWVINCSTSHDNMSHQHLLVTFHTSSL